MSTVHSHVQPATNAHSQYNPANIHAIDSRPFPQNMSSHALMYGHPQDANQLHQQQQLFALAQHQAQRSSLTQHTPVAQGPTSQALAPSQTHQPSMAQLSAAQLTNPILANANHSLIHHHQQHPHIQQPQRQPQSNQPLPINHPQAPSLQLNRQPRQMSTNQSVPAMTMPNSTPTSGIQPGLALGPGQSLGSSNDPARRLSGPPAPGNSTLQKTAGHMNMPQPVNYGHGSIGMPNTANFATHITGQQRIPQSGQPGQFDYSQVFPGEPQPVPPPQSLLQQQQNAGPGPSQPNQATHPSFPPSPYSIAQKIKMQQPGSGGQLGFNPASRIPSNSLAAPHMSSLSQSPISQAHITANPRPPQFPQPTQSSPRPQMQNAGQPANTSSPINRPPSHSGQHPLHRSSTPSSAAVPPNSSGQPPPGTPTFQIPAQRAASRSSLHNINLPRTTSPQIFHGSPYGSDMSRQQSATIPTPAQTMTMPSQQDMPTAGPSGLSRQIAGLPHRMQSQDGPQDFQPQPNHSSNPPGFVPRIAQARPVGQASPRMQAPPQRNPSISELAPPPRPATVGPKAGSSRSGSNEPGSQSPMRTSNGTTPPMSGVSYPQQLARSFISRPPIGQGQALLSILQWAGDLKFESPGCHMLDYWRDIMNAHFHPEGTMRFTLWKDNDVKEAKPFVVGVRILPRFFLVCAQSAVVGMSFSLDGATEKYYPGSTGYPPFAIVDCPNATWTYRYSTGYTVVLRGPLTGQVSLEQTASGEGLRYRIRSLEFQSGFHEQLIAVNSIEKERILNAERDNPHMLHRNPFDDPRIVYDRARLPPEPINAFGIPQVTMRCLELAESCESMIDLMEFVVKQEEQAPLADCLKSYANQLRSANPQIAASAAHLSQQGATYNSVPTSSAITTQGVLPSSNLIAAPPGVSYHIKATTAAPSPASTASPSKTPALASASVPTAARPPNPLASSPKMPNKSTTAVKRKTQADVPPDPPPKRTTRGRKTKNG